MELLLAFLCGFLLALIAAFFLLHRKNRELAAFREAQAGLKAAFEEKEKVNKAALEEKDRVSKAALEEKEKVYNAALAEKEKVHKEAMDALNARFEETVAKVSLQLKEVTAQMLRERQKEFSESSTKSIDSVVKPLKENLDELRKAMDEDSRTRAERNGEMRERITNLMQRSEEIRRSADELAAAFRHGSKIQGDWGETLLSELLCSQGLTEGIHFETQPTLKDERGNVVKTEDGRMLRPDVILHLDSRRELIIDSKVSLTAYINYANAETQEQKEQYLKEHVASLQKHVDELLAKNYPKYICAPKVSTDYVIMFVPNAGALWTALNAVPDMWRRAAEKGVYIADEQTLYAALRMVNLTWTQVAQARNHEKVYELANEMIDRVGQFVRKYDNLGKALKKAQAEYDEGFRKLDDRGQSILVTSNKLLRLGAKNSSRNPLPEMIDVDDIPAVDEELAQNGADESRQSEE